MKVHLLYFIKRLGYFVSIGAAVYNIQNNLRRIEKDEVFYKLDKINLKWDKKRK